MKIALAVIAWIVATVLIGSGRFKVVLGIRYYVHPQGQEDLCPSRYICCTLPEYAENSSQYFTSNATQFYFFGSKHQLEMIASFSKLTDIKLVGDGNETDSPVEIDCNGFGFKFEDIVKLHIAKLKFFNCSMITEDYTLLSGLFFHRVTDLTMNRIFVLNTTGYGVYMKNVYGNSSIANSKYKNCIDSADFLGGNVYLSYDNCDKDNKVTFHMKNTLILDGRANHSIHSASINNGSLPSPGLFVHLNCPNLSITLDLLNISGNSVERNSTSIANQYDDNSTYGGNMAIVFGESCNNSIVKIHNSNFTRGESYFGGGLFVVYENGNLDHRNQLGIISCTFRNNKAYINGGGLYFVMTQVENPATETNKSRIGKPNGESLRLENTSFIRNTVQTFQDSGIAVMLRYNYKQLYFDGKSGKYSTVIDNCTFEANYNLPIDGVYSSGSAALYTSQQLYQLLIKNSTFRNNNITALAAFRSLIRFEGYVLIENNTGYEGGGMVLCEASFIVMKSNAILNISFNHANVSGGGIFAEGRCVQVNPLCFYQIEREDSKNLDKFLNTTSIILTNNTANYSGSQLYGGTVDDCHIPYIHHDIFNKLFNITDDGDPTRISSDPYSVCFCNEDTHHANCSITKKNLTKAVYSGVPFNVSIVTVGQYNGTVPGVVELDLINPIGGPMSKTIRSVSTNCSQYQVTIYSEQEVNEVHLKVKNVHANYHLNLKKTILFVSIKPPPPGLVPVVNDKVKSGGAPSFECTKTPNIEKLGFKCFIFNNTGYITRPAPYWLGLINGSSIVVYQYCPQSHCKQKSVNITTELDRFEGDNQCISNHAGVLCGRCLENFSYTVGSSTCLDCTHVTLMDTVGLSLLMILLCLVLVCMLQVLNMTVTQGMWSGFLFYANIFFIFKDTLFPLPDDLQNTSLNTLKKLYDIFIAFNNLRFYSTACFYNGLDIIGKTWLQILLAFFMWLVTGMFVWIYRKSTWLSNRITFSTIPLLATVILLSYTNVFISIIHALTFARLKYSVGNTPITKVVMLYDGNQQYFGWKHIPLFIVGCVLTFLTIAFMATLLFIQPLQKYSNLRLLRWVNKLKPLIDAYTCPHIIKPHCRFWTGYLLFFRIILIVFFMLGSHDNRVKAGSVSISCLIVLFTALAFRGVYTKAYLNILNSSYILNIGILSITAGYYHQNNENYIVITSFLSLTVTIVTFYGSLCYHIYILCKKANLCTRLKRCSQRLYDRCHRRTYDRVMEGYVSADEGSAASDSDTDAKVVLPPCTSQYREPQLVDFDSMSQSIN